MKRLQTALLWLLLSAGTGHSAAGLLLEEPYGNFGGMIPTGHAAIYLSHVCADGSLSLRHCRDGEQGVVISRYHRIAGYDWIAIPLIPYLYAIDQLGQVPREIGSEDVVRLRDDYRRRHLEAIAPDDSDGRMPEGDWTQLIGAAYDRTIFVFEIQTSEDQDDEFIRSFNSHPNENHFNLVFHNCADFARQVINFYYPKAIHRSLSADLGIMTPKQAAKCLVRYSKDHPNLQFSSFVISQVPGTTPRSRTVRTVLESLIKSKRYMVPLTPLAILHPCVGGGLIVAWVEEGHFNPRRVASGVDGTSEPEAIVMDLEANRIAPHGSSETTLAGANN